MNQSFIKTISISQYFIFLVSVFFLIFYSDPETLFLDSSFMLFLVVLLILTIFNSKTYSKFKLTQSNWAIVTSSIFMVISITVLIITVFTLFVLTDFLRNNFSQNNDLLISLFLYPAHVLSYVLASFFSFIAFLKVRKL